MDSNSELRKYFDFDEADLYANRNGYLSQRQPTRDLQETHDTKKLLRIVGFCIFLIGVFLPVILFFIEKGPWQSFLWVLIWLPLESSLTIFNFSPGGKHQDGRYTQILSRDQSITC